VAGAGRKVPRLGSWAVGLRPVRPNRGVTRRSPAASFRTRFASLRRQDETAAISWPGTWRTDGSMIVGNTGRV
jgi:hypothetical protein